MIRRILVSQINPLQQHRTLESLGLMRNADKIVGEGQHSFHKTNLTPSVRLIHHIPEDITGGFYRGEPQVSIKDSIFEHSTSARHARELLQMF